MELPTTVALLISMTWECSKSAPTAAEELMEIIMRGYKRTSTLLTSNRSLEDWSKLLGDSAAVTTMLDRLPITAMSSNAGRGAGGPKQACPIRRERDKNRTQILGHLTWSVLK